MKFSINNALHLHEETDRVVPHPADPTSSPASSITLPSIQTTFVGALWWACIVTHGSLIWYTRNISRNPAVIAMSWTSLTAYVGGSILGHALDGITAGVFWLVVLFWWAITIAGAILLPLRLAIVPLLVVRKNIASRRWSLAAPTNIANNPYLSRYIDQFMFHFTVFAALHCGVWERRIIFPSSTLFTVVRIDHPSLWYAALTVIGAGLVTGAFDMTVEELALAPIEYSFRTWTHICDMISDFEAERYHKRTRSGSMVAEQDEDKEGAEEWEQVTSSGL